MSEWISVTERLPAPFVDVLCLCKNKETIGFSAGEMYCAIDRWCIWNDNAEASFRTTRFNYGKVTHWMPLPPFPEDK